MVHRHDANHRELTLRLEQLGCSVVDTSAVGNGFPDTVIGMVGYTGLCEFKTAKGKAEKSQIDFGQRWRGGPIAVVRNLDEAIRYVQGVRAAVAGGKPSAMIEAIRRNDLACMLDVPHVCQRGPTVPCHLNMQSMGKGMGIKAVDVVAAGCQPCHYAVDNGSQLSREDRQFYLLRGVARTIAALLTAGAIRLC